MSLPAWSFSSIKLFETCAKKYEAERIAKEVKYTDNVSTLYGKDLHLAAEEFIRDDKPIPERFKFISGMLEKLKALPGDKYCERKFGIKSVDDVLEPCDFFDKEVWFRGVADLLIVNGETARVIDYKTNKDAKYADTRQLGLLAACVFLEFPEVKEIKGALIFVVCNALVKQEYTFERRFDIFGALSPVLARREAAYESGVFNANPNGLCRKYCGVLSCVHNGSHK